MNKLNLVNFIEDSLADGGKRKKNYLSNSHKKPLLSIITVVYNNEKYIEEALNSLYSQKFNDYEHIIIDGGSNDDTLKIIKKYEEKIEYWCSKKDNGIYDAFNIGMSLAKGKYIGFLNSDDKYTENALTTLNKYINKFPDKDFIFGSVKKHWGILHGYKPYKIYWSWGFYSSHSTGFFIKNTSAKIIGLYNLKYKYSADYDYFFRMIVKYKMKGIATKKSEVFGIFRRGGYSSKIKFIDHFFEEIKKRIDNQKNKLIILIIIIYKYIKNLTKL